MVERCVKYKFDYHVNFYNFFILFEPYSQILASGKIFGRQTVYIIVMNNQ